jgi:hypothetical protein
MTLSITVRNTGVLSVITPNVNYAKFNFAEFHYAECRYAECHFVEFHGTMAPLWLFLCNMNFPVRVLQGKQKGLHGWSCSLSV